MALQSFKDLLAWQKTEELSLGIYKAFAGCTDLGFKDQIQRASISVMNNVAEGYGRRSDKALINFLTIARGSVTEVESMLLLALKLGYLDEQTQEKLLAQTTVVAKLLAAFISKVRTNS